MNIIADDDREIFSQLDKGQFKNFYQDETKQFAIAVDFAQNPLPDIEMEFARRGIKRKVKTIKINPETKEPQRDTDNKIIEDIVEEPIKFQISPLITFAHQWLIKRHPVNRKRVDELIRLASAIRMGELLQRQGQQATQESQTPMVRGRIA
jgi:hypothetical protein